MPYPYSAIIGLAIVAAILLYWLIRWWAPPVTKAVREVQYALLGPEFVGSTIKQETRPLRRRRLTDIPYGSFTTPKEDLVQLSQYVYWCPCGTQLTDGPSGGASVNMVCEKCRWNFGCLEGAWGDAPQMPPLGELLSGYPTNLKPCSDV